MALCLAAFDRECLEYQAALIQSISPAELASPEWEEDEPESISSLREVSKNKDQKQQQSVYSHISLHMQLSLLLHQSRFSPTTSDEE